MKQTNEYTSHDLDSTLNKAEQIILSGINSKHNELCDEEDVPYNDIHYIKKCLQALQIIKELKV